MHTGTHHWAAQQRVHHGMAAVDALSAELERAPAQRVFVTTTRSLADGALVGACITALGERFAGHFAGIAAHSPREAVIEGAARIRDAGADRVLAIGGGSVIDATKVMLQAIWYGLVDTASLETIVGGRHAGGGVGSDWEHDPQRLRMIAVPTTLSAAEFSHVAGVTDAARGLKQAYLHPLAIPAAVILDPRATLATPPDLLLSTGVRSVDHAVERWCASQRVPFADAMAREAMRLFARALPRIKVAPDDLDARADAQQAMWLSMLPQATGVPFGASHGIGYILGGAYGVPHGVTSCLMLPAVLEWNEPANAERQRDVAEAFGAPGGRAGPALREFVRSLGVPWRLRDVGFRREQLDEIAARYDGSGPIATNPRRIEGPAQVRAILELAW